MTEYEKLINSIKDKYDDFISGMSPKYVSKEHQKIIADYIKNNPDTDSSHIVFLHSQLLGFIPEEDVITPEQYELASQDFTVNWKTTIPHSS